MQGTSLGSRKGQASRIHSDDQQIYDHQLQPCRSRRDASSAAIPAAEEDLIQRKAQLLEQDQALQAKGEEMHAQLLALQV